MDRSAFDRIARLLGGATSRRQGLRAILGGAVAASGAVASTAARGNDGGPAAPAGKDRRKSRPGAQGPCGDGSRKDNICTKDSQCCTGICNLGAGKKNKDKKGRCRCIRNGKACKLDKNCCNASCIDGICGRGASCIPRGEACRPSDTCCPGTACSGGICVETVPTGNPCVANSSICAASNATCTTFSENDPAGTYCLLPLAAACGAGGECESANCAGGVCALQACDVCSSGCPYNDLDAALLAAPDNAIIRVDAGVWTTTNGESSTPGGGRIRDGRHLTVRACNGVPDVEVTSTQSWSVFYIESPDYGGWTLEGLTIYPAANKAGPSIYIFGKDDANLSTLTMRNCTVDNRQNSTSYQSFIEVYPFSTVDITDTTFTKGAGSTGGTYFGIMCEGNATRRNQFTMTRSTVQDCGSNAQSNGGIRLNATVATLTDCTISNNRGNAAGSGGGINLNSNGNYGGCDLTLAGTTTITGNTSTNARTAGGIGAQTTSTVDQTITIAPTASITGNTGNSAGGIGHMYKFDDTHGVLTVTGGDRVFGNTATSNYQCANVPAIASLADVPGCVWP